MLPKLYLAGLAVLAGCDSINTNSGSSERPTLTPTAILTPPYSPGESRTDCLPVIPQSEYHCPDGEVTVTKNNNGDITATQGGSHITILYSQNARWGDVGGNHTNCSEVVEAQKGEIVTVYQSCQNSPSGQ